MSTRLGIMWILALVFLTCAPHFALAQGTATDRDPNRIAIRELLTAHFPDAPPPLLHTIAVTLPLSTLEPLLPGHDGQAQADCGFVTAVEQVMHPADTTGEEWIFYAGNGEWGNLTVFWRRGEMVRRITGLNWRGAPEDSLVRAAPPQITVYDAAEFGMYGQIIVIDGMLDIAGNISDEVLHRSGGRVDRLTQTFAGLTRRMYGFPATVITYEDADGDRHREFVLTPAHRPGTAPAEPVIFFRYNTKKQSFDEVKPRP